MNSCHSQISDFLSFSASYTQPTQISAVRWVTHEAEDMYELLFVIYWFSMHCLLVFLLHCSLVPLSWCVTPMSAARPCLGHPQLLSIRDVSAQAVVTSKRQLMVFSHTEHHYSPCDINLVTCAHGSEKSPGESWGACPYWLRAEVAWVGPSVMILSYGN